MNINEKLISFIALGVSVIALVLVIGAYKRIDLRENLAGSSPAAPSQTQISPPEKFVIVGKVVSWDSAKRQLTIETEQSRRYSVAVDALKSLYTAQGSYTSLPRDFGFLPDQEVFISVKEEVDGKRLEFQALSITILK